MPNSLLICNCFDVASNWSNAHFWTLGHTWVCEATEVATILHCHSWKWNHSPFPFSEEQVLLLVLGSSRRVCHASSPSTFVEIPLLSPGRKKRAGMSWQEKDGKGTYLYIVQTCTNCKEMSPNVSLHVFVFIFFLPLDIPKHLAVVSAASEDLESLSHSAVAPWAAHRWSLQRAPPGRVIGQCPSRKPGEFSALATHTCAARTSWCSLLVFEFPLLDKA